MVIAEIQVQSAKLARVGTAVLTMSASLWGQEWYEFLERMLLALYVCVHFLPFIWKGGWYFYNSKISF